MFESVKQNDRRNGIVYLTSLLASLMAHAVILCMVIIVPLVFFSSLQADELVTFLITPPPPPPPPPPPTPPPAANPDRQIYHYVGTDVYTAPPRIPEGPIPDGDGPDFGPVVRAIPGALGGTGGTVGPLSSLATLINNGPIVMPEPPKPPEKPKTPIRFASLEPSKLIVKVSPVYPDLARKAHVSGAVHLEAVVDEEGNIATIKVLRGHPLLVNAAVDAVKQWKYPPTILNGEPYPIIATVVVEFHLN